MTEADNLGILISGVLTHFEMDPCILNGAASWSKDDLLAITLTVTENIRAMALIDAADRLAEAQNAAFWPMESTLVH